MIRRFGLYYFQEEVGSTAWMELGRCFDKPHLLPYFYSSNHEIAKSLCHGCTVKAQCLQYALENRIDHGVWGGQGPRQRRRTLKARRAGIDGP
jgi:WhiB family transcriptional regulator, redox-sensing transcriptional regulator